MNWIVKDLVGWDNEVWLPAPIFLTNPTDDDSLQFSIRPPENQELTASSEGGIFCPIGGLTGSRHGFEAKFSSDGTNAPGSIVIDDF